MVYLRQVVELQAARHPGLVGDEAQVLGLVLDGHLDVEGARLGGHDVGRGVRQAQEAVLQDRLEQRQVLRATKSKTEVTASVQGNKSKHTRG